LLDEDPPNWKGRERTEEQESSLPYIFLQERDTLLPDSPPPLLFLSQSVTLWFFYNGNNNDLV